jgi:hypothetical protein
LARYDAARLPDGSYYPFLEVDVVLRRQSQRITAIVDSGADRTVVPRIVVEALGVDFASLEQPQHPDGTPISGFGASGDFELKVCLGKVRWKTSTVCKEFWVADMGTKAIVLLGRDDFFRKYDVSFNWAVDPPYMDIEPVAAS